MPTWACTRALSASALELAHSTKADLVTLAPQAICDTFWQSVMALALTHLLGHLYPPCRVNDPADPLAMAVGGFILIRRSAYEQAGGHEAVRSEIVDDINLARRVKETGGRLVLAAAPKLAWTHMYGSFSDIWRGLRKNAYAGMDYLPHKLIVGSLAALVMAWTPWLALLAGGLGLLTQALPLLPTSFLLASGLLGVLFQALSAAPFALFLKLQLAIPCYRTDRAHRLCRHRRRKRLALPSRPSPLERPRLHRAPPRDRVIRAYKHGWPSAALNAFILRSTRKAFFRVRVQGLETLRQAIDADPSGILFLGNHSSWWDIYMAHLLNQAIPVDGYGMMEHFNLKRFGFFRRIGAFSVDRSDPLAVRAALDYTVELLDRPRAGVWLFPQGHIVGNDLRPLGFQPGLRAFSRRSGRLRIVPTALRYEFWQDERPEVFVRFGVPVWVDRSSVSTLLDTWEARLAAELDALKADVTSQSADRFTTLYHGTSSISDRFARLHALLFGATRNAPPTRPLRHASRPFSPSTFPPIEYPSQRFANALAPYAGSDSL